MPLGEVGTSFISMRLATNLIDGDRLFAEDEGDNEMIASLSDFISKDNVESIDVDGRRFEKSFQRQGGAGELAVQQNVPEL